MVEKEKQTKTLKPPKSMKNYAVSLCVVEIVYMSSRMGECLNSYFSSASSRVLANSLYECALSVFSI